MVETFARQVGLRLRAVRAQHGLSLNDVETTSQGRWKAVVVGSYERADRAVTVAKLAELAHFYAVPVVELLTSPPVVAPRVPSGSDLVINLARLAELPSRQIGPLARYVAAIRSQRIQDSDTSIAMRSQDLHCLAVIYDTAPETLIRQLIEWGVASSNRASWGAAPNTLNAVS